MPLRILAPTLLLSIALLGFLPAFPSTGKMDSPTRAAPADTGVAVVELFTSEGCSSCPPADRLLLTLVDEARTEERPIYALSFHVDYWNNLGWEDPYSDPAYSERQRSSAEALGIRVYTPQAVVNGTEVVVGSREREVRSALQSALSTPARASPTLRLSSDPGSSPSVHVDAPEAPDDAMVHVALVERGLSQSVARGENAGRTLRHANVVRAFKTLPAPTRQVVSLSAPSDLDPSKASVIAYVQDPASRQVLGAARVDLEGTAP